MSISLPMIAPALGVTGLVVALLIFVRILRQPAGEGKMRAIGDQIHKGAMTFMKREFKLLMLFAIIVGGLLALKDPFEAMAFFAGAFCSSFAGYVGMFTATKSNVRTAAAAHKRDSSGALSTAFFGGSIMGLTVASVGLVGIGTLFLFFGETEHDIHVIHGFAMGASLVALFFRVGGGIFTKAADVGADLVGKVEAGIPEDDPRNPGVIADNVGDNVGDVAGMGSDIFESYCGAQIATMAIAATFVASEWQPIAGAQSSLLFLPLALTSTGLICSLIGILLVKLFSSRKPLEALRIGTMFASVLFIISAFFVVRHLDISWKIWGCVVGGAVGGIIIGLITEYYTAGSPVKRIATSSETGVATVMITGLAVGMQSVVVPLVTFAAIILTTSCLGGIYGVAVAAVGMLATVGITMAIDAYGPVADNAGGIAEMSGLGPEVREITDSLDEVGNTTAAIGKGFAIGAAGLAALAIIAAFNNTVRLNIPDFGLDLGHPQVLAGLFIGGFIPFLVAAITMTAVGDAAYEMIAEIRRQFHEIPGLLKGESEPDTERCFDIATSAALRKMILPSVIAVLMPVIVGFGFGARTLGGMLAGGLLGCVLMALMMANSGGAWDNAKKYVEKGFLGGKNSDAHKACVVGDTVGDPLKDTSGPSMNILINVMAIVSLVIAPLLTK